MPAHLEEQSSVYPRLRTAWHAEMNDPIAPSLLNVYFADGTEPTVKSHRTLMHIIVL